MRRPQLLRVDRMRMESPASLRAIRAAARSASGTQPDRNVGRPQSRLRLGIGLAAAVWASAPACFAASNSRMAEDGFHTAAQLFVRQQDAKALEAVNEAIELDPSNEPAQQLKALIEAELQRQSSQDPNQPEQRDGSESEAQEQSGSEDAGREDAEAGQDQRNGSEPSEPTPEASPREAGRSETASGGSQTPTPPAGAAAQSSQESSAGLDAKGTPTPEPRAMASEAAPSPVGSAESGQAEGATPTPGPQGQGSEGMSPEQVLRLLQALTEDELSQLKARPVRIYGEQHSDEDW